jgi:transposase
MSAVQAAVATDSPVVVAVDVGKTTVALSVTDAGRHRLLGPVEFEMTGRGLDGVLALISSRLAGRWPIGSLRPPATP